MKKLWYKKDKSITIEIINAGLDIHDKDPHITWAKVLKDGKTVAFTLNFEAAREYIYKFLLDKKEYVNEEDFEEAE